MKFVVPSFASPYPGRVFRSLHFSIFYHSFAGFFILSGAGVGLSFVFMALVSPDFSIKRE